MVIRVRVVVLWEACVVDRDGRVVFLYTGTNWKCKGVEELGGGVKELLKNGRFNDMVETAPSPNQVEFICATTVVADSETVVDVVQMDDIGVASF